MNERNKWKKNATERRKGSWIFDKKKIETRKMLQRKKRKEKKNISLVMI